MKLFIKALIISGSIAILANMGAARAAGTGEVNQGCPLNKVTDRDKKEVSDLAPASVPTPPPASNTQAVGADVQKK